MENKLYFCFGISTLDKKCVYFVLNNEIYNIIKKINKTIYYDAQKIQIEPNSIKICYVILNEVEYIAPDFYYIYDGELILLKQIIKEYNDVDRYKYIKNIFISKCFAALKDNYKNIGRLQDGYLVCDNELKIYTFLSSSEFALDYNFQFDTILKDATKAIYKFKACSTELSFESLFVASHSDINDIIGKTAIVMNKDIVITKDMFIVINGTLDAIDFFETNNLAIGINPLTFSIK
jgi:hypothetical protein